MKKFFFILRRVGKGIKADVKDPRDILGEMRNLIVFQAEHFGIEPNTEFRPELINPPKNVR